jgi:para-aminobenzoate synthetase/4-amino-4-deoxychorismate lyase
VTPLPPIPDEPVPVKLARLPVDPSDFRLRHKTTDRGFYDAARTAAGTFEVIFVRPDGLLTEGSFTNIFVPRHDKLMTPPLFLGLLPGIRRAALIGEGRASEAMLTAEDLEGEFYLANDLRGLIRARLA